MFESENPFRPPISLGEPLPQNSGGLSLSKRAPRSWVVSLALWTFVCVLSAAPSFFWGMGTIAREQYLAMVLGIAAFIALYTWVDQLTKTQAWRRIPAIVLTLKIGYITRMVLSLVIPIGAGLDLFCGLLSVGLVEAVYPGMRTHSGVGSDFEGTVGFGGALLITLVQGVVLNGVLAGYMTVVFALVWAFKPHSSVR